MNTNKTTHYIIQTACAQMPGTCWGEYRRVAVLEVAEGVERASMISDRAKDVVQVVATWEKLNVGTTERCAYEVALREARELIDVLAHEDAAKVKRERVNARRRARYARRVGFVAAAIVALHA